MIVPFLLTMSLCALVRPVTALEVPMDEKIPSEERVHVARLSNGVKTYVQENQTPQKCVSVRILSRTCGSEDVQYAYDGNLDSLETLEHFFLHCKEKAFNGPALGQPVSSLCYVSSSSLACPVGEFPEEVAVVVVGDFVRQEVELLIEKHFGSISLGDKEASIMDNALVKIGYNPALSNVALRLSYPNTRREIHTYRDLLESWKFLLIQDLFQQRLEHCSRILEETWVHPHPRFFYPVHGYTFASEDSSENLLCFFLWQVESVRHGGFLEDEFYVAKRKIINQLQYLSLNAQNPDDAFLASYYADQFLLGERCLSYQSFLNASATLVQEMQCADLFSCLPSFFSDQNRQIQLTYPIGTHISSLTDEKVEKLIDRIVSLAAFYRDSDIAEAEELDCRIADIYPRLGKEEFFEEEQECIRPIMHQESVAFRLASHGTGSLVNDSNADSFHQLPLDDKEKRIIKFIISTMAEKNILQLALEKFSLEKKGKKIHHVHPLRFMGFILSSSDLKNHVRSIKKSSFKWDAFISGFAKRMREELSKDNVYQHVEGFAELIGATPEQVSHYIHKKDFEGLVKSQL